MDMPEPSRMMAVNPEEVDGLKEGDPVCLIVYGTLGKDGMVSIDRVEQDDGEEDEKPLSVVTQESHA